MIKKRIMRFIFSSYGKCADDWCEKFSKFITQDVIKDDEYKLSHHKVEIREDLTNIVVYISFDGNEALCDKVFNRFVILVSNGSNEVIKESSIDLMHSQYEIYVDNDVDRLMSSYHVSKFNNARVLSNDITNKLILKKLRKLDKEISDINVSLSKALLAFDYNSIMTMKHNFSVVRDYFDSTEDCEDYAKRMLFTNQTVN